jgi:hypothetical protein
MPVLLVKDDSPRLALQLELPFDAIGDVPAWD